MKLQCQVEITNRSLTTSNIRPNTKHSKSTLALGQQSKSDTEFFIIHFSTVNKTGVRYALKNNIKQVFVKCLNDGKATIRFENPPHDLSIKADTPQLKNFLNLLKKCLSDDTKDLQLSDLSNISVTPSEIPTRKLIICERAHYPQHGLPKSLEALIINGINLHNVRKEIATLQNLVVLDLRDNDIEKVPHEIGNLPCLEEVHLSHNKLGILGSVDWRWLLGPGITKSLVMLDLSNNIIGELPQAICKLRKLDTLKLDDNLIEELPNSIGTMSRLKYLSVSTNRLKFLPCSILECKMSYLDLAFNAFANNNADSYLPRPNWDMYAKSLLSLAACAVLKNKIYYAPDVIPFTLVPFLDTFCYCYCGNPVTDKTVFIYKTLDRTKLANRILSSSTERNIILKCYFCSPRCFKGLSNL